MEYDFEKLAREITAERLRDLSGAPAAAAEIAAKIIASAVNSTKDHHGERITVVGVCRGVMTGLVMIDKELPDAAIAILQRMTTLAQELHLDPMETMTWAMEGIAAVAVVSQAEAKNAIRGRIDERFMGAGEIFGRLCEEASARTTGS